MVIQNRIQGIKGSRVQAEKIFYLETSKPGTLETLVLK